MDKKRIIELYELLAANKASYEECAEFERLLRGEDAELSLKEYWGEHWSRITKSDEENVLINNYESIFEQIIVQPQKQKVKRSLWLRYAAAASVIFCLSVAGYFILHKKRTPTLVAVHTRQDIAPGTNQATLTLANGKKIILTKALSGKLAQQGNMLVQVNGGNAIAYTVAEGQNHSQQPEYNTLSTAIGEQSPYPLILADGSKVWLNAESSITFPVAFNGKERVVKMTGEAYFEVAHNAAKPFRVVTKNQIIEDIGTAFNINAYDDEPLAKTTLVKGAVKVSGVTLKPGDQAISNSQTNKIEIARDINTNVITAWKDGYFRFDLETLPAIMREFARWYNVEVVYESKPTEQQFNMKVSRKSSLSRALQILTKGGVHYRLEDRKLILIP